MEGTQTLKEKLSSQTEEGKAEREMNISPTDPRHCSLRHSGVEVSAGSWALRIRLWRSVLGRRLGLAMWRQPEGLRSDVPWLRSGLPRVKGNWEEAWAHRRRKSPLLGRAKEEGSIAVRIYSSVNMQVLGK